MLVCSLVFASFDGCVVASSGDSSTGDRLGEMDAGLTVALPLFDEMRRSSMIVEELVLALWPSCELKSSCERVTGISRRAARGEEERVTMPALCR